MDAGPGRGPERRLNFSVGGAAPSQRPISLPTVLQTSRRHPAERQTAALRSVRTDTPTAQPEHRTNIAVFGATGGTGRAVIHDLLAAGHSVTALIRDPAKLAAAPGLTVLQGDATNSADVARAVPGHDAVVVSLGNSQSPFGALFGARRTTPRDICEAGTRVIVGAMRDASVARLVVVTAFGVGDTRDRAPLVAKIFFTLLLREQMADKEKQEAVVKASGLDWTLIQPVGLSDALASGHPVVGTPGPMGKQRVSRADVAAVVVQAVTQGTYLRQTVTVAG